MKFIFGIIIYNIITVILLIYVLFFSANDVKLQYLKDVSGIIEDEALELLKNYEINIEYVESNEKRQIVLYTNPSSNELVYDNQLITLYVSKGYISEKYENLVNEMYEDYKDYLNKLVKEYKIELNITYKNDEKLLDGIIYEQKMIDDFIDEYDLLELVVISNPITIKMPNFIGWYYQDVINYSNANNINVVFEYIQMLCPTNYVVGQSVGAGSDVLKNSNPITIYLSKEI